MKNNEYLAGDYLVFTDGGHRFALPSTCVREILYPHTVTPLPFVPACIEGLINVEGTIAVQVDFGLLTRYDGPAPERVELVLVDTGRALCALKVAAVIGRVSLPPQAIRAFANANDNHAGLQQIEQELLAGEASHEGQSLFIVDHARIGRLVQAGKVTEDGTGMLGKADNHAGQTEQEYIACLAVRTGNERYAFELTGIMEIIQAGNCTAIPGAPAYLKGFHLVRDEALLIIDLLSIIDHREQQRSEDGWIIIISRDGLRYGFQVEGIDGIENFPLGSYQPVFDPNSNISGLFVHQDQTTMLLSPDRIVTHDIFAVLSRYAAYQAEDEELTTEETERYLQVRICDNRYAIPIDAVRRVTQFFPMENAHDTSGTLRGAIDIDGRIIPVLALERALTLGKTVEEGEYVIVGHQQQEWAICVDNAHRIVDIPLSQISRMAQVESRFVNGIAHIDDQLVSLLDFSPLQEQKNTGATTSAL